MECDNDVTLLFYYSINTFQNLKGSKITRLQFYVNKKIRHNTFNSKKCCRALRKINQTHHIYAILSHNRIKLNSEH